jgi:hypothetical protein
MAIIVRALPVLMGRERRSDCDHVRQAEHWDHDRDGGDSHCGAAAKPPGESPESAKNGLVGHGWNIAALPASRDLDLLSSARSAIS